MHTTYGRQLITCPVISSMTSQNDDVITRAPSWVRPYFRWLGPNIRLVPVWIRYIWKGNDLRNNNKWYLWPFSPLNSHLAAKTWPKIPFCRIFVQILRRKNDVITHTSSTFAWSWCLIKARSMGNIFIYV